MRFASSGTHSPRRTSSLPPHSTQCIPSAWIMSRTRYSIVGMFHELQCGHFIAHSHFDEFCQRASIVLSDVLAVPVNRRMPHLEAFVDCEMMGMLSVSWSCTSSKSMTSA